MRDDKMCRAPPVERHHGEHYAGQPAHDENDEAATRNRVGHVARLARRQRRDPGENWIPAGTLTAMLAAEKKLSKRRHAGGEHVVGPDAKLMKA